MKKFLVSAMMFMVMAVGLPLSVEAAADHCRKYRMSSYSSRNYRRASRTYARNYRRAPRYETAGYVEERRPSFYRRHRNLVNIGVATGAGALIGGLLGGRRGVAYGLMGGAGAGALYTYKLNPKKRRYTRY